MSIGAELGKWRGWKCQVSDNIEKFWKGIYSMFFVFKNVLTDLLCQIQTPGWRYIGNAAEYSMESSEDVRESSASTALAQNDKKKYVKRGKCAMGGR